MTQYTITSWFIIKSWATQWGHLAQTSRVTRHEKPTPLLCQVSGPFHDLLTARLLLYIGVSRGTFAKFRPETDAFIEISNLTQSLPHNQTPTSKFQVPSTRVKWVDMSRWESIYSSSTHFTQRYPSIPLYITVNEPWKGHEKDLILDIEEELVFRDESPNEFVQDVLIGALSFLLWTKR